MRRGIGMKAAMLFAAGALATGVTGMWENRSDLSSHIAHSGGMPSGYWEFVK